MILLYDIFDRIPSVLVNLSKISFLQIIPYTYKNEKGIIIAIDGINFID